MRVRQFSVTVGQPCQLDIARGEDCQYDISFANVDGSAFDFTSFTSAVLTIRDQQGVAVLARLGTTPSSGKLRFVLASADTEDQAPQTCVCDAFWTDGSSKQAQVLVESPFIIRPSVHDASDTPTGP